MSITNRLQPYGSYVDGQIVQLAGPDSTVLSYQYDQEQRTFYIREALLTGAGVHGSTHILQDPIPEVSCNTKGLMSSDDKCKLDSIVGTRLGVLGFQGAGFPDDGGWLQGDIILASGSEFITLERVGKVIRFVVDIPTPYVCAAEECFQVYWIQDESAVNTLRPPSCGGRLPNLNTYGEFRVYLFPESTIINPNKTLETLNKKGLYPNFIFRRYSAGVGVNEAEVNATLKRNQVGTTLVGWSMTPGTTGTPECIWFMGTDSDGGRIDFKLDPNSHPGLMGQVLYNGSSITKKMGIITGYHNDVLGTNRYKAKWWDIGSEEAVSDEFTVVNLQQWDIDNNQRVLDSSLGNILGIGQFIDVWTIKCGNISCYYSKEQPILNVNGLWATLGAVEFGFSLETHESPDDLTSVVAVPDNARNDFQILDFAEWGMTNIDDPVAMMVEGSEPEIIPSPGQMNFSASIVNQTSATLAVLGQRHLEISDDEIDLDVIQKPIYLWHKASLRNAFMEIHIARPTPSTSGLIFPPVDILTRAPINTIDTKYCTITDVGEFDSGQYENHYWIKITGVQWHDLNPVGAIRAIGLNGSQPLGQKLDYIAKLKSVDGLSFYLVTPYLPPEVGVIAEILHEEYTTPAARLQFRHAFNGHDIEMQVLTGKLDVNLPYNLRASSISLNANVGEFDDPQMSNVYWQNGTLSVPGSVDSSTDGFYILDGGVSTVETEHYNIMRIMVVESQLWVWWNDLLIPPAGNVNPYYTIDDVVRYGKFGLRLWPGAKIRRAIVRSKLIQFSEYTLGQLSLS